MVTVSTESLNINDSYVAHIEHIAKLAELKQSLGINKSEIIRRAIEEYYDRHADDKPAAQPEQQAAQ